MSKLAIFVTVYSVFLIVLFSTFCYLMTTVNPPEIKPDTYRARKFGFDDVLYPNEVLLSSDNVGYGLEKVDYGIEINPEVLSSTSTPEIPRTAVKNDTTIKCLDKNKTNCSKKDFEGLKVVTKAMPVKGFRRSINENKLLDNPGYLLLKINDVDGQPQIEIKVLTEKNKKNLRKNRSDNNVKKSLNFTNTTDTDYDSMNKTVVNLDVNETLVIKIDSDLIEYDKTVETFNTEVNSNSSFKSESDDKIRSIVESGTAIEAYSEEKNGGSNNNTTMINNETEISTYLEIDVQNRDYLLNKSSMVPTTDNANIITENTVNDDENLKENIASDVPTANLVGLLIPEATATLPYNYHFIT